MLSVLDTVVVGVDSEATETGVCITDVEVETAELNVFVAFGVAALLRTGVVVLVEGDIMIGCVSAL